jgi:hypothetical protein
MVSSSLWRHFAGRKEDIFCLDCEWRLIRYPFYCYALRDFLLASYVYQNMLLNYGSSLQVAVHYIRPNHLQSIPKQVLEPNDLFVRKKLYALYAFRFILTSYNPVDQENGIHLPAKADILFRAEFMTTLRPNLLSSEYWG